MLTTIRDRIAFLQKILNGEIELTGGTVRYLKEGRIFDEPCQLNNLVRKLGGSFETLGKGASGKVYDVCIDPECNYNFVIKEIELMRFKPYIDPDNPYRPENAEITILKLLNDLLLINATPHIPLYFGDFKCKIGYKDYRYLMVEKADGAMMELIKELRTELHRDMVDQYLRVIFFQIFYTLRIIQKRYNYFKHNDLHPGNVLYYKIPKEEGSYFRYTVDGNVYTVPNIGYRVALWDFDFSSINGVVENIKTDQYSREGFSMTSEPNHYTDIFKILNLTELIMRKNPEYGLPEETVEFIRKYVPRKFREFNVKNFVSYGGLVPDIELITTKDLLLDGYFSSFRRLPREEYKVIDSYSDELVEDPYLTGLSGIKIKNEHTYILNCEKYKQLDIPLFRRREGYNTEESYFPYRSECYETPTEAKEILDKPVTVEYYAEYYKPTVDQWLMEVLISPEVAKRLMSIYPNYPTYLKDILILASGMINDFIGKFYVPLKLTQMVGIILLDKAIFYLLKYHAISMETMEHFSADTYSQQQIADAIVQIDRYLARSGREVVMMERYKDYVPTKVLLG